VKTTEVISIGERQAVELPDEFRFEGRQVTIRREGEAVILEPIKTASWPVGFFDDIRIEDPSFQRPPQGDVPPSPAMDSPP
jgi:antitoxin VapB